jgi:hypothetical protein
MNCCVFCSMLRDDTSAIADLQVFDLQVFDLQVFDLRLLAHRAPLQHDLLKMHRFQRLLVSLRIELLECSNKQ